MFAINRLAIPLVGAAGLAMMVALPAHAAICAASAACPTTMTVTVTAGALTITVPDGPVSIGSAAPGAQASGQLTPVTVNDLRATLSTSWIASVSSGNLTTGLSSGPETIPNTAILYWSGLATATTGTGTFTEGQANAGAAQTMDASRTAYSMTAGTGNTTATWNPTLVVNIPAGVVAGTYTGTVNHSVV
jgi:hypothetical protein